MKRSEINDVIREMEAMVKRSGVHLPPFCHLTPEQWACAGAEQNRILQINEKMLYKGKS